MIGRYVQIEVPENINMPENKEVITLDDEESDENISMEEDVPSEMKEEEEEGKEFIDLSDNEIEQQNKANQQLNINPENAAERPTDVVIRFEVVYNNEVSRIGDWSSRMHGNQSEDEEQ